VRLCFRPCQFAPYYPQPVTTVFGRDLCDSAVQWFCIRPSRKIVRFTSNKDPNVSGGPSISPLHFGQDQGHACENAEVFRP